jgi:predicted AAA+ superfamily ATPase
MYFDEAPKSRLEDLYDFETQVEQLRSAIRRRNRMMVILGLRRTGKTSLLQSWPECRENSVSSAGWSSFRWAPANHT